MPKRKPIQIKPSHEGELHADTGTPQGQPIPEAVEVKAKQSPDPAVRRRATFALNARKWHHQD